MVLQNVVKSMNEDSYDIQLNKLISDYSKMKKPFGDKELDDHLAKNKGKGSLWATKMKQRYGELKKKDPEKEMDTRRLARKGIEEGGLEDACWDGYKAIGTKEKNGKRVPNCVPEAAAFKIVSLLTGSADTAKIERFLESYKLDLSSYNSFDLTEAFKKFKA